jgi:hypothetical protein
MRAMPVKRDGRRANFLPALFFILLAALAATPSSAAQEGSVDASMEDRAGVLGGEEEAEVQSGLERLASRTGRWSYAFLFDGAPGGSASSERERFFDEAGVVEPPEGAVLLGVVTGEDRAHVSAPGLSSAEAEAVTASMEAEFRGGDFAKGLLEGIEELEERLPESKGDLPAPPPKYQVLEDGTFIIGGDVVGDCRTLLEDADVSGTADSPEIAKQVEACTEAGFPPRGVSLPGTGGPSPALFGAAALLGACVLGSLFLRGLRCG